MSERLSDYSKISRIVYETRCKARVEGVQKVVMLITAAKAMAFDMRNDAESRNDQDRVNFFRGRVTQCAELEQAILNLELD